MLVAGAVVLYGRDAKSLAQREASEAKISLRFSRKVWGEKHPFARFRLEMLSENPYDSRPKK